MYRFKSLAWRIYLAFLLAAVIPTAVAGLIGIYFSLETLKAETSRGLEREVVIRAQGIGRFLEQAAAELLFLAEARTLAELRRSLVLDDQTGMALNRERLETEYAALARLYPYIYQLRFLDALGKEQARVDRVEGRVSATPVELLQDKSDRYYVHETMARSAGDIYVSPLDLNIEFGVPEEPERPVIRIATPTERSEGTVNGMVIINLHADVLLGQVQAMADARDGLAILFDRAGYYVARGAGTEPEQFEMRPIGMLEPGFGETVLERIGSGAPGIASSMGWTVAWAPVGASGRIGQWTLALAYPEHRLFDAVFNLYLLYAVLTISLLVTAFGGFAVSRRLLGPLELLSRETGAIAAGDFSSRVKITGNDEIAELGSRFNAMAARLQTLYASLEQQRDRLEIEVRERTRDLEQERVFLAALVRHLGEGVLVVAEDGRLRLANPPARRLLSIGESAEGAALADYWPDWRRFAQRIDQGGAREDLVLAERIIAVSISRLDEGLILLLRDVTEERRLADERRELDRQMFQMERMVTLGELAMGLAHEIGNPLAGMKTVVQALQYEEDLPPGVPEALQRCESEIDRLTGFLRSFRGIAAPPEPVISDCDPVEMLRDVLFWVGKEARSAGVAIITEGVDGAPLLRADPRLFKQVLLNLLINALHAMPDGGRVAIRAESGLPGHCLLRIEDTGRGIEPELLPKIFDPFFTTRADGTGLGLAIVRKIVTTHGASIRVDSVPGQGTSFALNWPIAGDERHA